MAVTLSSLWQWKDGRREGLARVPLVRQALLEFRRVTGLAAVLVPPSAPERSIRFGAQEPEYCRLGARLGEAGCQDCYQTQLGLFRRLEKKLRPQQVCCQAGLVLLAVPIVAGGEHVGTVVAGKVRVQRGPSVTPVEAGPEVLKTKAEEWKARRHTAFSRMPVLTESQLRAMVGLLDALARLIGEAVGRRARITPSNDPPRLAEIRDFVRRNLQEPLTTRQAAKALHLNTSYFCRVFRRLAGMTFREYVAGIRVEAAKEALLDTRQTITEVGFVAGFQSTSDFSRVFKARAGVTPSEYRQKARAEASRD